MTRIRTVNPNQMTPDDIREQLSVMIIDLETDGFTVLNKDDLDNLVDEVYNIMQDDKKDEKSSDDSLMSIFGGMRIYFDALEEDKMRGYIRVKKATEKEKEALLSLSTSTNPFEDVYSRAVLNQESFDNADETFKFTCQHCGNCCQVFDRSPIMINPVDLYRLARVEEISASDFIKNYCQIIIGGTSGLPILIVSQDTTLTPSGYTPIEEGDRNYCLFFDEDNMACRFGLDCPSVCKVYPLGRIFGCETKDRVDFETVRYILDQDADCPGLDDKDAEEITIAQHLVARRAEDDVGDQRIWNTFQGSIVRSFSKTEAIAHFPAILHYVYHLDEDLLSQESRPISLEEGYTQRIEFFKKCGKLSEKAFAVLLMSIITAWETGVEFVNDVLPRLCEFTDELEERLADGKEEEFTADFLKAVCKHQAK